jgi:hypothetical protein
VCVGEPGVIDALLAAILGESPLHRSFVHTPSLTLVYYIRRGDIGRLVPRRYQPVWGKRAPVADLSKAQWQHMCR